MRYIREVLSLHEQLRVLRTRAHAPGVGPPAVNLDAESEGRARLRHRDNSIRKPGALS
jgi:hypothetical protein